MVRWATSISRLCRDDGAAVRADATVRLPGDPFGAVHGNAGFDANVSVERIDDVVVLANLPGFERDGIELTDADRTLTIDATNEDGVGETYRPRTVRESLAVPEDVDPATIEATYRNDVLEVRLPVDESGHDDHRIDIE